MDDALLGFLETHGAGTASHSDDGLLSHLRGTAALLESWEARPALCTAGLIHSVYGTESYRSRLLPLDLRPRVRELAGEEAEDIAFRFGALEKPSLYANLARTDGYSLRSRFTGEEWPITAEELGDLCDLTVANWLEQRPRARPEHRLLRREEFAAMRGLLLPAARSAITAAYGFDAS